MQLFCMRTYRTMKTLDCFFASFLFLAFVELYKNINMAAAAVASTSSATSSSKDSLSEAVIALAAGDARLVRYDAIPATTEKQEELCDTVMSAAAAATSNKADRKVAIQAFTLCITNNPTNRETFATMGLHGKILTYLDDAIEEKDSDLIASIGNLIWISAFGNLKNHQGFGTLAVKSLAKVFDTPELRPIAYMFSGAALQNLAASYCHSDDDPDNPVCYWEFLDPLHDDHVSINEEESGEMYIDGTEVRQAILSTPGLVDHLVAWACRGPFAGPVTEDNPSAALNAVVASAMLNTTIPPHEDHTNIVPWAAVGALKNLALLPEAKAVLEAHEPCLCRLSQSYDWLEHTKASDLLGFLRPSFPCWFRWEPEDVEAKDVPLCVDHHFRDANGNTCYDYEYGTSEEECATPDANHEVITATEACCGCGGGNNINMPLYLGDEESDEL